MDALLTRLGNVVEEQLSNPALDSAEFDSLEDLVAACRQVASLQPDGTRQPMLRCEGIAALLQGMLELGEQQQQLMGPMGGGANSSSSSGGGGGLSPEAEAYAQRVVRLVRCKLGELRTAVPSRMSDAGSGEEAAGWLSSAGWLGWREGCSRQMPAAAVLRLLFPRSPHPHPCFPRPQLPPRPCLLQVPPRRVPPGAA